ncbi:MULTISPECIES: hypothetical protein [unclassified Sphingomonas]|uniref:hypothetical protein n=1 Tax=unclassified Sphingomonas TaxID=196159 RepID=UPI000AD29982|nr:MULTISPECIES: hypothetical protein [unclassified Sphingomonas]
MSLVLSRPYQADELFRPAPHGPKSDRPDHMNLSAHRRPGRAIDMASLRGAGVYGLFLDGALFYVGIYSGAKTDSMAGSVLTRWRLHLTYQTLRSPNVCFTAADVARILDDAPNAPFDAIAGALGGREVDRGALAAQGHPLIETTGASCTYRKARFAARNWDLLRPGREDEMFARISFVYARLDPAALPVGVPMDRAHRQWIKYKWLERCERHLIDALKPICNKETAVGTEQQATLDDFRRELIEALKEPLPPYSSKDASVSADLASTEAPTVAAEHIAEPVDTDDSCAPGEIAFRARLDPPGEAFLDELDLIAPAGIELDYVGIPQARLYREPGHAVLVKITATSRGVLRGYARTGAGVVQALGFADPVEKPGWTDFAIDPAIHQPTALIALAGAVIGGSA